MEKKTIRLSEKALRHMIYEAVEDTMRQRDELPLSSRFHPDHNIYRHEEDPLDFETGLGRRIGARDLDDDDIDFNAPFESKLRGVVRECVKTAVFEAQNANGGNAGGLQPIERDGVTYYPVTNTQEYVQKYGLTVQPMYKVGTVQARPAVNGRQNAGTRLEGGFQERDAYTENANAMIVKNPRGEEYQVPIDEFNRKYKLAKGSQPDQNGYQTYNVYDERMISSPIKHDLYKEMPNWGPGQKQFARAGDGHIVNPQNSDSYFIADRELKDTHVAKQTNETKLREMVKREVRRAITEAGHIYFKDDDGDTYTNSQDTYRGVPGSTFIWHGEWADPEIWYDGVELNGNDIEDGLWSWFNEDVENADDEEREQFRIDMGLELKSDDEDVFEKWIEWKGGPDFVKGYLDDVLFGMSE